MIATPVRTRRASVPAAVLAGLLLAANVLAQGQGPGESDLLDQARRMDRVAAQKLESDLRQALREAERLARTDRTKAIECLKKALTLLEQDTLLSPERRQSLERMFRDRIRITASDTGGNDLTFQKTDKKQAARNTDPARSAGDAEKLRQSFRTIQQLQTDGKTDAANRAANGLAEQQPHNPAVNATEQATRNADQVANARRLQRDHERQLASAFRDIDRAATLPSGDVEFPKDWKERTKGRTTAVPLTAKEQSLLRALNTTISVNFRNSKLEDVIEFLQTYTGQAILLDREAMKEIEISYDTAITLNVKGVAVRTVLRRILADLGMTYVIKDETIQATSAQRAKEMMTVRRYYVGDLLAGMGSLSNVPAGLPNAFSNLAPIPVPPSINPQIVAMQKMETVKHLMELIQSSVEPSSWQSNGGGGTISFHAPSLSLVIKQSAEVHALLGSGGLLR